MHPLIAASLSTQLAAGRRSAARSHRRAEARGTPVADVGDGSLEAARALDGGLAVADPFRPSALHAKLLALRARQLGRGAPRGLRGVLHPRAS
jgi:hypothetical protein